MRNLRHADPGRTKITKENVVLNDVVLALANKGGDGGVNAALARFEETRDSRFGMVLNQSIDKMIGFLEMMKAAVNAERKEINDKNREEREARKG